MSIIVKSGVPGKIPTASQLDYGQLALNYADQKIYFKNSSNVITEFTSSFTGDLGTNKLSFSNYVSTDGHLLLYAGTTATGYAIGVESSTMYYRANATHRWYLGTLADAGTSQKMYLNSTGLTASGNITAYSDIKLKKDLVQIAESISKIRQLTGYTYTRKDSGHRQTGLIAQDVQKVLPEAVTENQEGILGISYGNLAGLLVESIKELDSRLVALERRLDAS